MTVVLPEAAPQPLTVLTEEEMMFRDTVRQFAEETIAPRVHDMDEAGRWIVS
jgi:alkylation response protein AidB-like acyl-CoA dehydrogenase